MRPLALLLILSTFAAACASNQSMRTSPAEFRPTPRTVLLAVERTDGTVVRFERGRPQRMAGGQVQPAVEGARIQGDAVVGISGGQRVSIPLADVREMWAEERKDQVGRTALLVGGGILLAVAIGAAMTVSDLDD